MFIKNGRFHPYYPSLTLLIFTLLDMVTFFPTNPFVPKFLLIGVFFWGIHRPDLFSSLFVFILSCFLDVANALPLGFYGLINVTLYLSILIIRRHLTFLSFYTLWFLFAALTFVFLLMAQAVLSFWYTVHFFNFDVMATWMATVYCYPFVSYVLTPLRRAA